MSDTLSGGMQRANLYCPNCGSATPPDAIMCAQCGATLPSIPGVSAVAAQTATAAVSYLPQTAYGGFWIRFVAAFLDGLLVEIVVLPVSFALGAGVGLAGGAVSIPDMGRQIVAAIGGMAFGLVVGWLYEAIMES